MTYTTWIIIAVAWLMGSFIISLGIGLLFEDERYEEEYLSEDDEGMITPEDIRRIMHHDDK